MTPTPEEKARTKPRLTDKVIRGLHDMAMLTKAGTHEDLYGHDSPETRKKFKDAWRAIVWVEEMMDYREQEKERGKK